MLSGWDSGNNGGTNNGGMANGSVDQLSTDPPSMPGGPSSMPGMLRTQGSISHNVNNINLPVSMNAPLQSNGPGGLVSMAPVTSISGDVPAVSSGMSQMGPGPNMQPMPMRPMMTMGGPQTIISSQQGMANGPISSSTMTRTGPPMGGMFRPSQPNMMQGGPGQPRMMNPGVRMQVRKMSSAEQKEILDEEGNPKTTILGTPWSPLVLYEKESSTGGKVLPQQSTVSDNTMKSLSNETASDVTQESKSKESLSSGRIEGHLPQAIHWTWTDDPDQIERNEQFLHLLPNHPVGEEMMLEVDVVQLLDDDRIEKAHNYVECKIISAKFVCLGKDKNKKPHKADEETFKVFGFCKKCLYEAYGQLNDQAMAYKQQNKKKVPKKTDATLVKINKELEKLPEKERKPILQAIEERHRLTGDEFKERLRGLGMGFYPENKNRKIQQFQHDSVLCYYAYGLKCLTLVFDPISKDLLVIGAPEVREELNDVAKDMKGSKTKKAKFDAGTDLIKRVLKRTPQPSPKTVDVQITASEVWNNAFAQKSKSGDAKKRKEGTSQKKNEAKKRKKNKPGKTKETEKDETEKRKETEKNETPPIVETLEGKIINVIEEECHVFKSCKECESKDIEMFGDDDNATFFCPLCSKIVETIDNVLVLVKVKLNYTVDYAGKSFDEALVQLGEVDLMKLLPRENLSTVTSAVLIGANVGPDWFRFDDPIWKNTAIIFSELSWKAYCDFLNTLII